jgi:uncharacterized protein (TIGR02118 family)
MIKTVTLLKRRPDLTSEEFHRHWREIHGPLVLALPGVLRYVQCRPLAMIAGQPDVDGIAEVWYADVPSMRAALESAAYVTLIADEVNFMGPSTKESIFMTVEEDALR